MDRIFLVLTSIGSIAFCGQSIIPKVFYIIGTASWLKAAILFFGLTLQTHNVEKTVDYTSITFLARFKHVSCLLGRLVFKIFLTLWKYSLVTFCLISL